MNIGMNIKTRRRDLRISQIDLARIAGVAVHTLSDIESGKGNPTLEVLLKITDPLGLELSLKPKSIAVEQPAAAPAS